MIVVCGCTSDAQLVYVAVQCIGNKSLWSQANKGRTFQEQLVTTSVSFVTAEQYCSHLRRSSEYSRVMVTRRLKTVIQLVLLYWQWKICYYCFHSPWQKYVLKITNWKCWNHVSVSYFKQIIAFITVPNTTQWQHSRFFCFRPTHFPL